METMIQAWQKLRVAVTKLIHECFASSVLRDNERLSENYGVILAEYCLLVADLAEKDVRVSELEKRLLTYVERDAMADRDGAIAVQVIRERMRHGESSLSPNVDIAHSHAAKQRNMELVRENTRLRKLLERLSR